MESDRGVKIYRVKDFLTGELGGWVSDRVSVSTDSWVGKDVILCPMAGNLSVSNGSVIEGRNIGISILEDSKVILDRCRVSPYSQLFFGKSLRTVVKNCVFCNYSQLKINNHSGSSSSLVEVSSVWIENRASIQVTAVGNSAGNIVIKNVIIFKGGSFIANRIWRDMLVNKLFIGDDCEVFLEEYQGIIVDGLNCIRGSRIKFKNSPQPLDTFGVLDGDELIIVDTEVMGSSRIDLSSVGGVVIINQEIDNEFKAIDKMTMGVFKRKNQFIEEWDNRW